MPQDRDTFGAERGTPGNWKLETPNCRNPFEPAFVAPSQADAAGPFFGRVCRSFGSRLSVTFFPSAATCYLLFPGLPTRKGTTHRCSEDQFLPNRHISRATVGAIVLSVSYHFTCVYKKANLRKE